jgi:hypothetical protein
MSEICAPISPGGRLHFGGRCRHQVDDAADRRFEISDDLVDGSLAGRFLVLGRGLVLRRGSLLGRPALPFSAGLRVLPLLGEAAAISPISSRRATAVSSISISPAASRFIRAVGPNLFGPERMHHQAGVHVVDPEVVVVAVAHGPDARGRPLLGLVLGYHAHLRGGVFLLGNTQRQFSQVRQFHLLLVLEARAHIVHGKQRDGDQSDKAQRDDAVNLATDRDPQVRRH